ncbi:helix-turn-helix transcriptional regulator [uncultured Algoriphagus sp.]|uniref:helix-turn-helix transcriptional regulator n=1 Tax=uncultured Algoriphagus sp. TaxID=417365 RepID=UPI0030EC95E2|tara:strand:- start:549 stop:1013 length:465 start_codon:yes stop_codon:yes gene_type:complete
MDFLRLNIKYLRVINGLTQVQLAEILDVSRSNIASYESGTIPPVDIVHRLVNHFNIKFNDFIEKDLSSFESKNVNTVLINTDREIPNIPKQTSQVNEQVNPIDFYRAKNIESLERIITAQETVIRTQQDTIDALKEVITEIRPKSTKKEFHKSQ